MMFAEWTGRSYEKVLDELFKNYLKTFWSRAKSLKMLSFFKGPWQSGDFLYISTAVAFISD